MNYLPILIFIFFFEIADKMMSVQKMYVFFLAFGVMGLILGYFKWWYSLIWLVIPTGLFSILFLPNQIQEINLLYEDVIKELGESYILHTYLSAISGILLNILGIFIGIIRNKKSKLK